MLPEQLHPRFQRSLWLLKAGQQNSTARFVDDSLYQRQPRVPAQLQETAVDGIRICVLQTFFWIKERPKELEKELPFAIAPQG